MDRLDTRLPNHTPQIGVERLTDTGDYVDALHQKNPRASVTPDEARAMRDGGLLLERLTYGNPDDAAGTHEARYSFRSDPDSVPSLHVPTSTHDIPAPVILARSPAPLGHMARRAGPNFTPRTSLFQAPLTQDRLFREGWNPNMLSDFPLGPVPARMRTAEAKPLASRPLPRYLGGASMSGLLRPGSGRHRDGNTIRTSAA